MMFLLCYFVVSYTRSLWLGLFCHKKCGQVGSKSLQYKYISVYSMKGWTRSIHKVAQMTESTELWSQFITAVVTSHPLPWFKQLHFYLTIIYFKSFVEILLHFIFFPKGNIYFSLCKVQGVTENDRQIYLFIVSWKKIMNDNPQEISKGK